ncbi:hypothetical protein [Chromatium okenii]|uniref:Uncharacterized protein n=1 Tax=Chromatium okenii TaxID=61644 RepID=A0A2S7XM83_9GAMM|nr:hypothetical protein [Chromatium okenii]PQJ94840.1 hypothetical protein CXB77_18155 [Chromatium okenii]
MKGWIVEDITGVVDGADEVDEGIDTLRALKCSVLAAVTKKLSLGKKNLNRQLKPELPVLQVNATELMIDESGKNGAYYSDAIEASDETVTVQYAAMAETATAGSDYKILGTGTLKSCREERARRLALQLLTTRLMKWMKLSVCN